MAAVAPDDFGHAVGANLSDEERRRLLTARWRPDRKEDFPVSHHTKKGVTRPRRLNVDHLQRYKWLAVPQMEGKRGPACSVCMLFGASDECGRRSGKGQALGKLGYLVILVIFHTLTNSL